MRSRLRSSSSSHSHQPATNKKGAPSLHDGYSFSLHDEDHEDEHFLTRVKSCTLVWLALALAFGYAHLVHVESLFENDKHFSHLSTLERELSFRTESGLYYYYFKSLVVVENATDSAPLLTNNNSLVGLVYDVFLNDNRTEHPNTINSLQRFNLYPELVLAIFYRFFNNLGLLKRNCFNVYKPNHIFLSFYSIGVEHT